MAYTNLYIKYDLSEVIHPGFVHALPYHPLKLVAAHDDCDTSPVLVIGYDRYKKGRAFSDVPRTDTFATHVTATLLRGSGELPLRFTWGAACFVETFNGTDFILINPHLAHQAATFHELDSIKIAPFKLFHPSVRQSFQGTLNDESWRYFDSCMSIRLTERQFKNAAAAIEKWKKNKKNYQVMGFTHPNCQQFLKYILEEANIPTPLWWGKTPWPGIDVRLLEYNARKKRQHGLWFLQSSADTRLLAEDALPKHPHAKMNFCVTPPEMVPAE